MAKRKSYAGRVAEALVSGRPVRLLWGFSLVVDPKRRKIGTISLTGNNRGRRYIIPDLFDQHAVNIIEGVVNHVVAESGADPAMPEKEKRRWQSRLKRSSAPRSVAAPM